MKKGNTVGDNIRRLRENEGITQEGLALKSGLSQGYINQLENGKRRYTQKTLELIAEALSVPVIEFFKEYDERRNTPKIVDVKTEGKGEAYKKEIAFLLKGLPDHIAEHYLTLLKLEKKLLKRSNQSH